MEVVDGSERERKEETKEVMLVEVQRSQVPGVGRKEVVNK
jgi:hypothetical protein